MVGPSITDEDRETANTRLKVALVLLVGVSGGLVSLQVDPTPTQVAVAVAASLVVGAALAWFVSRTLGQFAAKR